MSLLQGCGEGESSTHDLREEARQQLADGNTQGALSRLQSAMRQAPDDADLRLLAARAYLDSGRGDLAEVTLDQAIARGALAVDTLEPRARALLLQQRFAAVRALEIPGGAPADVRLGVRYAQVLAQAALTASGTMDQNLTMAYVSLLEELEADDGTPAATEIIDQLAAKQGDRPELSRAWAHHRCVVPNAVGWTPAVAGNRRVLRVGPDRALETPAQAAETARDGDLVELDSGIYRGGIARWTQSDLLIRGVGERPLIIAEDVYVDNRDVWLFTGDDVTVENVSLQGARSPYGNGAGIRHMGRNLTLRHVLLEDNEMGLLTSNRHPDGVTVIEHSEFRANIGRRSGLGHNVYIGRSGRFVMRFSYSHGTVLGHLVKSRARDNLIAYNRLSDGEDGASSYLIDVPEGGSAVIMGNEMLHGTKTNNHGMISFAGEELRHDDNRLVVSSNTIYNRDFKAVLVRNHSETPARIVNNLIGGAPVAITQGPREITGNLTLPDHGLADPRSLELDFSLTANAPAIDAAEAEPVPDLEYVHPLRYRERDVVWRPDVGAHERCGLR